MTNYVCIYVTTKSYLYYTRKAVREEDILTIGGNTFTFEFLMPFTLCLSYRNLVLKDKNKICIIYFEVAVVYTLPSVLAY